MGLPGYHEYNGGAATIPADGEAATRRSATVDNDSKAEGGTADGQRKPHHLWDKDDIAQHLVRVLDRDKKYINSWLKVLDKRGVDKAATDELILLSQLSLGGWEKAHALMVGVMDAADNDYPNLSTAVQQAVLHARRQLQADDHQHTGTGQHRSAPY